MHEASIAKTILEELSGIAREKELAHVRAVTIKIGVLSDVDPDALRFAFEQLKRDTTFSQTALLCDMVPIEIRCDSCETISTLSTPHFACPRCHSQKVRMTKGEELQIASITT